MRGKREGRGGEGGGVCKEGERGTFRKKKCMWENDFLFFLLFSGATLILSLFKERERELVNCLRKAITICHVYGGMFFARTINYLTIFINSPIFGKFGVNKT